jgi:hypothetical protein
MGLLVRLYLKAITNILLFGIKIISIKAFRFEIIAIIICDETYPH